MEVKQLQANLATLPLEYVKVGVHGSDQDSYVFTVQRGN